MWSEDTAPNTNWSIFWERIIPWLEVSCSCFPCLAEQASSQAEQGGMVHLSKPSSISASPQTPALPGEGWSGEYPSDTQRCPSSLPSCCAPAWLARAAPMAGGQGDRAPHTRGAPLPLRTSQGTTRDWLHTLTASHSPWSWAPVLQDWASLWINQTLSVLLWMQKAGAGFLGYLETSSPNISLLLSVLWVQFLQIAEKFCQTSGKTSALTGLIVGPLITNIYSVS